MRNKTMPTDMSCRTAHGGCGRNVIVVREKTERKPFGNQIRANSDTRLTAIHEDEINEHPEREFQRVRATPDQFMTRKKKNGGPEMINASKAEIVDIVITRAPSDMQRDVALFLVSLVYDDPLESVMLFRELPAQAKLLLWTAFRTLREMLGGVR